MVPFLISLVLSQAVTSPPAGKADSGPAAIGPSVARPPGAPPPGAAPATASPWGRPLEWRHGTSPQRVWVSPVLVAEVSPSSEGVQALERVDATAVVVAERAKVRLWRVKDAAAVRAALPALLVVVNDLPSTGSRARVPVGLLCGGQRVEVTGLAALQRAAEEPNCTPDFWTQGFTR